MSASGLAAKKCFGSLVPTRSRSQVLSTTTSSLQSTSKRPHSTLAESGTDSESEKTLTVKKRMKSEVTEDPSLITKSGAKRSELTKAMPSNPFGKGKPVNKAGGVSVSLVFARSTEVEGGM